MGFLLMVSSINILEVLFAPTDKYMCVYLKADWKENFKYSYFAIYYGWNLLETSQMHVKLTTKLSVYNLYCTEKLWDCSFGVYALY